MLMRVERAVISVASARCRVKRWARVVSCWVIGCGGDVVFGGRNFIVASEFEASSEEIVQAFRSRLRCLRRMVVSEVLRGWVELRASEKAWVNVVRL